MMLVMVTVFFGLQYFRSKNQTIAAAGQTLCSPNSTAQTSGPDPGGSAATTNASAASATVPCPGCQTTTIENELYSVTFTNRGAQVTNWTLKRFKDSDGKPLNLVHDLAAKQFGYPLSFFTYDSSLTTALNSALYVPSATGKISAPGTLSFKYSSGNIDVTKTFSFDETYVLHAGDRLATESPSAHSAGPAASATSTTRRPTPAHRSTTPATARRRTSHPRKSPAEKPSTVPSTGLASATPTSLPSSFPSSATGLGSTRSRQGRDRRLHPRRSARRSQRPHPVANLRRPQGRQRPQGHLRHHRRRQEGLTRASARLRLLRSHRQVPLPLASVHPRPRWGWAIVILTVVINLVLLHSVSRPCISASRSQRIS